MCKCSPFTHSAALRSGSGLPDCATTKGELSSVEANSVESIRFYTLVLFACSVAHPLFSLSWFSFKMS